MGKTTVVAIVSIVGAVAIIGIAGVLFIAHEIGRFIEDVGKPFEYEEDGDDGCS